MPTRDTYLPNVYNLRSRAPPPPPPPAFAYAEPAPAPESQEADISRADTTFEMDNFQDLQSYYYDRPSYPQHPNFPDVNSQSRDYIDEYADLKANWLNNSRNARSSRSSVATFDDDDEFHGAGPNYSHNTSNGQHRPPNPIHQDDTFDHEAPATPKPEHRSIDPEPPFAIRLCVAQIRDRLDRYGLTKDQVFNLGYTLACTKSIVTSAMACPDVVQHVSDAVFEETCRATLWQLTQELRLKGEAKRALQGATSYPASQPPPRPASILRNHYQPTGHAPASAWEPRIPASSSTWAPRVHPNMQDRTHHSAPPVQRPEVRFGAASALPRSSPSLTQPRPHTSYGQTTTYLRGSDLLRGFEREERIPRGPSKPTVSQPLRDPVIHANDLENAVDGLDSISHAFTRLGIHQGKRPTLSATEASLVLCVEIPECIPHTYHHRQWREGDSDPHLFELRSTATINEPTMINRAFYTGSFNYFVSFGQSISSPPVPASRKDLGLGDVYLHVDRKGIYISAWVLVLRDTDMVTNFCFWKNVSAAYVANSSEIRHPTQGDYVLHCHYTIRPQYIKSTSQARYKKDELAIQGTLVQVASDAQERLHRIRNVGNGAGKSRAMDVDIVE